MTHTRTTLKSMTHTTDTLSVDHPLLSPSPLPYELPDFAAVSDDELAAGVRQGMAEQRAEVETILASDEAPTFGNTVRALELTGQLLRRTAAMFFTLTGSDGTDARQALAEELEPALAAHEDAILLDPRLAARVARIDGADLTGEDARLLEVLRQRLEVAGAHLDEAGRAELTEINTEIAGLSAQFSRRLVADTSARAVLVTDRERLAGLEDSDVEAAAAAAREAGHEAGWLLTLSLFTSQPWLSQLEDASLREEVFRASVARGSGSDGHTENATLEIAGRIVRLRARKAALLGSRTWAEHALKDRAAPSVEAVWDLLGQVIPPAMENARADAALVAGAADGEDVRVAPWDWPFLAARHARERYAVDASALRPYFPLERVLVDGVFAAASRLYGLAFTERPELAGHLYRPGLRVWEVTDESGMRLGLFVGDFFARATKQGGAWMHTVRDASTALDERPVVFNTLNIPAPAADGEALLTLDEVTTLFHEFGHALHGLLAEGEYPSLTGTAVARDVVEFPSQVNELWEYWPSILADYAKHHDTGEALDRSAVEAIEAAALWGEGYRTVEYAGAVVVDLAWHSLTEDEVDDAVADPAAFEDAALRKAGIDPDLVPPRYSTGYFKHIFSSGYAAGYYSYLWAEVLDADTVEWFREHGGLERANGDHFRATLLARGNTRPMDELYRDFRSRDPQVEPLLRRRGLLRD